MDRLASGLADRVGCLQAGPMDLAALSHRALEIRDLFAERERSRSGRPWNNAQLAQGFVVDVGDLMRLVMAKEGVRKVDGNVDAQLAHELADCLWSVLVLAQAYGIDLETAFTRTMDELEAKLK